MGRGSLALYGALLLTGWSSSDAATKRSVVQETVPVQTSTQRICPDPSRLRGLCDDVYRRIEDGTNRSEWTYAYERKIFEASCVDFTSDTAETARAKIQTMWRAHQVALRCDSDDFDVTNGSVLKYAVAVRTWNFIDNAISVWGVDLNIVDESDGHTVLDYIEEKIALAGDPELKRILSTNYSSLRNHGAKNCAELPDVRHCKPVRR